MTETEWLAAVESEPMLKVLRGSASERRLRLFASASFRRLKELLPDPRQHLGIDVLEQLAEGKTTWTECRAVIAGVRNAMPRNDQIPMPIPFNDPYFISLMLYREFCSRTIGIHASTATGGLVDGAREQYEQARLIRDIFGNPFRPVTLNPSWLTSTVVALTNGIYEERAYDRMPILADALQDAGCDNEDVLSHCRESGKHWRGCWCVDLILNKK